MKKFLVFFCLIVLACSAPIYKLNNLPKVGSFPQSVKADKNPIVQLINKDNQFVCTAVVFDTQYAVTAAHCLQDYYGELQKDVYTIRDERGKDLNIKVLPAGVNPRVDLGIVKGNFSEFKMAPINPYVNGFFDKGPFVACGFPFGQNAISCVPFFPKSNMYFSIQGGGALVPGMSGGPVINLRTQTIVGVNSAVGEGVVYVVPLLGLFGAFELD